jgi:DNA-directed RNA polymerase subunit M/transcription elongation factor TFIIS
MSWISFCNNDGSIILEMKKLETCHHCGEEKENCYHGFITMCIPVPEMEAMIDKWGRKDWWNNLEREDLTEEEMKELDNLSMYDQMLSTVGRGVQCEDCGKKEAELYEKYYPKSLES